MDVSTYPGHMNLEKPIVSNPSNHFTNQAVISILQMRSPSFPEIKVTPPVSWGSRDLITAHDVLSLPTRAHSCLG